MAVRMFAAIEVGSFELEMGIYEISGKNRIRQVDHVRHVISLGSDTYNDRKISYEMVEELCRVLEDFSRIMKGYRITEYRAYATSAMREAKNSRIVLEQIRVRTGLTVQIISNSEQRLLTYKARLWQTMSLTGISARERPSWTWGLEACRSPCLTKSSWYPQKTFPWVS